MNNDDEGGWAFPLYCVPGDTQNTNGMTLRDWFAGQALAVFANEAISNRTDAAFPDKSLRQAIATFSYAIADAMLAERNKP